MGSEVPALRKVRLIPGRTGLWCPTCARPTGYEFAVGRDPAPGPRIWLGRCSEDQNHLIEG